MCLRRGLFLLELLLDKKQTYWSIPVNDFLNFLFCYYEKKSHQTPFSKHADAQRRQEN
jgi:hypothetical protein